MPPIPTVQNPDRKVTIGALGGALGVLTVYLIGALGGIVVPAEPAMAMQVLIIFILQYFVPNKPPVVSTDDGNPK